MFQVLLLIQVLIHFILVDCREENEGRILSCQNQNFQMRVANFRLMKTQGCVYQSCVTVYFLCPQSRFIFQATTSLGGCHLLRETN